MNRLLNITFFLLAFMHLLSAQVKVGVYPSSSFGKTGNVPHPIHKTKPQKIPTKRSQETRRAHISAIMDEVRNDNLSIIQYQFPSNMDMDGATQFVTAYSQLDKMLKGEEDLSLKEAIFQIEKAFLGDRLDKEWYEEEINESIKIILNELKAKGHKPDNELAKKMVLHQFMSDTIVIKDDDGNELYRTNPKKYDFNDIYGENDWTKMFVTKLMFTGTGQCHSMPLLYLILAEQLDIEAHLALSPEHSFIKLKDEKGTWFNLELTNGNYASDSWLLSSGYVKAEAIQNGIYMKPMSKKETIAMCLVDLGMGYLQKYGWDEFVLQCAENALKHSPKNISALQLRANYHTFLFDYVAKQMGYPPPSALPRFPKLYNMYQQTGSLHKEIDNIGYESMPPEVYKKWLESLNNRNQQTNFPRP